MRRQVKKENNSLLLAISGSSPFVKLNAPVSLEGPLSLVIAKSKFFLVQVGFIVDYFSFFFFQITCEVKAKYTTDPLHPWSDTVTILHPFFAGIMVGIKQLCLSLTSFSGPYY